MECTGFGLSLAGKCHLCYVMRRLINDVLIIMKTAGNPLTGDFK